jgi:hypothetical protein
MWKFEGLDLPRRTCFSLCMLHLRPLYHSCDDGARDKFSCTFWLVSFAGHCGLLLGFLSDIALFWHLLLWAFAKHWISWSCSSFQRHLTIPFPRSCEFWSCVFWMQAILNL